MSNYKKSMWEILFIILGGLLTVGLSIMAVIKGNKQEAETKKYQQESRRLQDEMTALQIKLNKKSDQIIRLNEELRKVTNSHLGELKKMTKRIPAQVKTLVNFTIDLPENERQMLHAHFALRSEKQSNIITKTLYEQLQLNIPTLTSLFNSSIRLTLQFTGEKAGKNWNVSFQQQPIVFTEHPLADNGTFMIHFDDKFNLSLTGFSILSSSSTSSTHSLYDFNEYEVSINASFSKPILIQDKLMYTTVSNNQLVVEPCDLILYFEDESGFNFKLQDFVKMRTNSYTTKGSLHLD